MNFKKIIMINLLTLVPIFVKAGGGDAGGGNTFQSSPQQVMAAISDLKKQTHDFLDQTNFRLLTPSLISDVELRTAITTMFGVEGHDYMIISPPGIRMLIHKANFQPSLDKPCIEEGKRVDASTLSQKGAPICFNVKRLTRIPVHALRSELIPLFLHEIAHQFGINESGAQKVQKYFQIQLKNLEIYTSASILDGYIRGIEEDYTIPDATVCLLAGRLSGLLINSSLIGEINPNDLAFDLYQSCNVGIYSHLSKDKVDRKKLLIIANKVLVLVQKQSQF